MLLMLMQLLNLITHRNDNAAVIPGRELKKLVYGSDSVFARSPTAAQVGSVTAADVADFLHTWERPDGAVFGMAGVQPCALFGAAGSRPDHGCKNESTCHVQIFNC